MRKRKKHIRPPRKVRHQLLPDASVIKLVEERALRIGVWANLLMALAGWLGYYFSGSSALSFDGNYAFISAISCAVAIRIARHKDVRNDDFPYGHYSFESLYTFLKGLSLLAIIIYALIESSIRIARYAQGFREQELHTVPILIYMAVTFVICIGMYFYYSWQHQRTGRESTILQVEASEALMDTLISLGMGIALLLVALVPQSSRFVFLQYLGDPLIVIGMSLAMLHMPLRIVRSSFFALVGRTLHARPLRFRIERTIRRQLGDAFHLEKFHLLKSGSCYEVTINLRPVENEFLNLQHYRQIRSSLQQELGRLFPNLILEILIE